MKLKTRKWLRAIFGCISLTAVAFVFQACYGTEPDWMYDIRVTGTVRAKTTNLPIQGIKIIVNHEKFNYGFTDKNGKFDFYASVPSREHDYFDGVTLKPDSVYVHFLDIDSIENGYFKDKTIIIDPALKDEVKIYVELDEKQ